MPLAVGACARSFVHPVKWPGRGRAQSCVKPTKLKVSGRLCPCLAASRWATRPPSMKRVLAGASATPQALSRSSSSLWPWSASARDGKPRTTSSRERTHWAAPSRCFRLFFSLHTSTTSCRETLLRSTLLLPPWGGPDSLPPSRHPASGLRLCAHRRMSVSLRGSPTRSCTHRLAHLWSRLPQKVRRSASRTPLTCLPAMLSLSGARAWCALRPGLPPNEPVSKSGAEMASSTWAVLFWRARSQTVGIPMGRFAALPGLGLHPLRTGGG